MATHPEARRYTIEEWDSQRSNIQRMYVEEGKTVSVVIDELRKHFGFIATKKTLKTRLTIWRMDVKNVKGDTMREIARVQAKRRILEDKDSGFRVNKRPVKPYNIERYMRNNNISATDLISQPSPMDVSSPAISVFTPAPSTAPPYSLPGTLDTRTIPNQTIETSSFIQRSNHTTFRSVNHYERLESEPPFPGAPVSNSNIVESLTLNVHSTPFESSYSDTRQSLETDWVASLPPTPSPVYFDDEEKADLFDLEALYLIEPRDYSFHQEPPQNGPRYLQVQEDYQRGLLSEHELKFGIDHAVTLTAVFELGVVLLEQGRPLTAEPLFRRVALGRQRLLGNHHVLTLDALERLAVCITNNSRYRVAEDLFRQILQVRTADSKTCRTDILHLQLNLGTNLLNQSRFEDANSVFIDVLKWSQENLGYDNYYTLRAMNYALHIFSVSGKIAHNLTIERQLLLTLQKKFGFGNFNTISTTGRLISILYKMGQHYEGQSLFAENLTRLKVSHGENHILVLRLEFDQANLLLNLEKYQDAQALFERLWSILKFVKGVSHMDTLTCGGQLGHILLTQGRHEDAQQILKEVSDIALEVLGLGDPRTLLVLQELARLKMAQGKHLEAESILREAPLELVKTYGELHFLIFDNDIRLASSIAVQGRLEEASRLLRQVSNKCIKALGEEHKTSIFSQERLSYVLMRQGNWEEAEQIALEASDISKRVLGISHQLARNLSSTAAACQEHRRHFGVHLIGEA